jgi:drug/metabolite transporter (DMT)-like permease
MPPLSPRLGVLILIGASTALAANHLSARVAFDHGASVFTATTVRATSTALVLLLVMRLQGVKLALPPRLGRIALIAGVLIACQSYTLYSAVAAIPPALALLVFQTAPAFYVLLTWALGKEKPRWSVLPPMLLALAGLGLALDLRAGELGARWGEIGAGVSWAAASMASMTVVYFLNANALKVVDGRLRTCIMTAIAAPLLFVAGAAGGAHALPLDAAGWTGLVCLTAFYCAGMVMLFYAIARVPAPATAALNFEPIALLLLAWLVLGHTVTPLQLAGAFLTVGALVWLALTR